MSVPPTSISGSAATPPPAGQSVLARLKAATAAAHGRVDAAIDLPRMTESRYPTVLGALARAHALVESALAPHVRTLKRFDYDLAERSKHAWLAADLSELGAGVDSTRCATWRALSLAEGFGALYVIDGAPLGGRVTARELASAPYLAGGRGCRYLAGYGADAGRVSRLTSRSIEGFDAWTSGAYAAEIVNGANATFSLFERELRAELEAPW
jgi:heme oxygenase